MTFDDFKKQFEIFSKIDTAEKLAICESQYEKHLLHIEAENYFEPKIERLGDDIISKYEKNLNDIFLFNKVKDNQFYFLVVPSFEPENLLILERERDNYVLTHVALTKNYWALFYADNKISGPEKTTSKAGLSKAIGDKLFALLDKTIIDARQPKAGRFTLDGIAYILSKVSNGVQKTVFKHSPTKTSKSGQIIEIMQQLIDNIGRLDDTILLNIETSIRGLHD